MASRWPPPLIGVSSALIIIHALTCMPSVMAQDASHYVGAVVEFSPKTLSGLDPLQNMMGNINTAQEWVERASLQKADIVVFPEVGLVGFGNLPLYLPVPAPENRTAPCADVNYPEPMRKLSCMARVYKIYLVVNLPEEAPCGRTDRLCHYNTNVVFDRSGTVIARYRKWNLFGERSTDKPPTLELSTFDTDFGVRFGQFICFDILFEKPTIALIREKNVTDVVFSSAWFSEVPFLTAVQTQQFWAHRLNVNLLASGINFPPSGCSGSGIYRGQHGALETHMDAKTGTTLMVQRIPKSSIWSQTKPRYEPHEFDPEYNYKGKDPYEDMKGIRMIQDHVDTFRTKLVPRPEVGQTIELNSDMCHGEGDTQLCCDFQLVTHGVRLKSMTTATNAAVGMHSSTHRAPQSHAEPRTVQRSSHEYLNETFDGFHYRLMVFSGVRDHSKVATTGTQVCGILSCLSRDVSSCGWIAPGLGSANIHWTEFTKLSISGNFSADNAEQFAATQAGPRYAVLPTPAYTLQTLPISLGKYNRLRLDLETPLMDLRTFSIYGRKFDWDGRKPTPPWLQSGA